MSTRSHREAIGPRQRFASLVLGTVFAVALFVLMALAQMMGRVRPPEMAVDENLIAYVPPEIQEIKEEPPPPPEEEEPPPEQLEQEPPQLSLDQLDIALNPGTGGALVGDFSMPVIGTSFRDLGTEEFVDFSNLDQVPRPIGVSGFNFPRRLRREPASGRIVLLLKLNEDGEVLDVQIDSSNLPSFDSFVLNEVRRWKFTPPTQNGRPVKAKARLPIPITIS
jgi:protein TonB